MQTGNPSQTMPNPAASPACRHHWLIEEARGPTSRGRCRRCGAHRDFFNFHEDALLSRDNLPFRRETAAAANHQTAS